MARFFNTTGPCKAESHYMLPPEQRLPDLVPFVQQELYFVVHSARQTGKTTAMIAFAERLRGLGYAAVYATLETSQGRETIEEAEPGWLTHVRQSARFQLPPHQQPPAEIEAPVGERLRTLLSAWSEALHPTPLILLLDEVDVIRGVPLVNLLRQLRAGFSVRPQRFPASIALIGMRDLRDYLTHAKDGAPVNPGSPFNIKKASLTLRNFTRGEIAALYAQHTADTGQLFEEAAIDRAFWWTQGQPFLVNALADLCVMELLKDRSRPVKAADIDEAKERLVLSRTTHLDALAERLKEPRVARIIQPIILGDTPFSIPYDHDDFQYALDLGLVRRGPLGAEPACPLYREVLARQLSYNVQEAILAPWWRWRTADGRLDFPALIEAFLEWWRENEQAIYAHGNQQYPEALPHLSLMAFLQRVVNGGGQVMREYAAGKGAIDLLVCYGHDRFPVEIKRVFPTGKSPEKVREQGIDQLAGHLETLGQSEGWLFIFDQRKGRTWEERLWRETLAVSGRTLHLVGA